jgi:hypothetical protein
MASPPKKIATNCILEIHYVSHSVWSSTLESGARFGRFQLLFKAHFTPGVKANVQLKSSIPIGGKVEISPKGFTLKESKAEIEKKKIQSAPSY